MAEIERQSGIFQCLGQSRCKPPVSYRRVRSVVLVRGYFWFWSGVTFKQLLARQTRLLRCASRRSILYVATAASVIPSYCSSVDLSGSTGTAFCVYPTHGHDSMECACGCSTTAQNKGYLLCSNGESRAYRCLGRGPYRC